MRRDDSASRSVEEQHSVVLVLRAIVTQNERKRDAFQAADRPPTKLDDEQTWKLAAFIHAISGQASANELPGNADDGKQIFWVSKVGCSNCHSICGEGARMGPHLTNIGILGSSHENRIV